MTSVTSQLLGLFLNCCIFKPFLTAQASGLFIENWSKNVQPFGPGILNLMCPCSQGRQRGKTYLGSASCLSKPSGASSAPCELSGNKENPLSFLSPLTASLGLSLLPSQESWCLILTWKTTKGLWSPFYWVHLFLRLPGD